MCEAEPIVVVREIKPVSITPEDGGFRYDFGEFDDGRRVKPLVTGNYKIMCFDRHILNPEFN